MVLKLNNPLVLLSLAIAGLGLTLTFHTDPDDPLSPNWITLKITWLLGTWEKNWKVGFFR